MICWRCGFGCLSWNWWMFGCCYWVVCFSCCFVLCWFDSFGVVLGWNCVLLVVMVCWLCGVVRCRYCLFGCCWLVIWSWVFCCCVYVVWGVCGIVGWGLLLGFVCFDVLDSVVGISLVCCCGFICVIGWICILWIVVFCLGVIIWSLGIGVGWWIFVSGCWVFCLVVSVCYVLFCCGRLVGWNVWRRCRVGWRLIGGGDSVGVVGFCWCMLGCCVFSLCFIYGWSLGCFLLLDGWCWVRWWIFWWLLVCWGFCWWLFGWGDGGSWWFLGFFGCYGGLVVICFFCVNSCDRVSRLLYLFVGCWCGRCVVSVVLRLVWSCVFCCG